MSNVTEFPKRNGDENRMVMRCSCGNCSFFVGFSGYFECTTCGENYTNDIHSWVINREAPIVDGDDPDVIVSVTHDMQTSESALKFLLKRGLERSDEISFAMLCNRNGSSSWWSEAEMEDAHREWVRRRVETVMEAEKAQADGKRNRLAGQTGETPES